MKSARNESCHCGSGKKYKNCHGRKSRNSPSLWISLLLGAVAVVAILAIVGDSSSPPSPSRRSVPPQAGVPAVQPGAAPPGKVWSAEHGHWHDAPKDTSRAQALTQQPPGPTPAGKVWSKEHGHWHDSVQAEKQVVIP